MRKVIKLYEVEKFSSIISKSTYLSFTDNHFRWIIVEFFFEFQINKPLRRLLLITASIRLLLKLEIAKNFYQASHWPCKKRNTRMRPFEIFNGRFNSAFMRNTRCSTLLFQLLLQRIVRISQKTSKSIMKIHMDVAASQSKCDSTTNKDKSEIEDLFPQQYFLC